MLTGGHGGAERIKFTQDTEAYGPERRSLDS